MTKARDLSKIIGANGVIDNTKITLDANEIPNIDAGKITSGSIASARLGNVPASDDASALTSGTLPNARLPNNIIDTGTAGTKLASGTTAQRGSTTGQWRYNSETGFFEGRNASAFSSLEPVPTVASVNDTEVDSAGGGNQTIVITGTNFSSGSVASFVGSSASFNASSTTINSPTQITAVAPKSSFLNAQEPYTVKVTSSSGLAGTSTTGLINVDNEPTWSTSAGSLGSLTMGASGTHFTLSATDQDGDTVAYTVQSGSLPTGTSLNSSTGVISGTISGSASTFSFNVRATANTKTADRTFAITTAIPSGIVQLSGSGTWSVPTGVTSAQIMILGGGGSGGRSPNVVGGGGGAGGIVWRSSYTFSSTDLSSGIAYVVGAGGIGVGMNGVTDGVYGGTQASGNNGGNTTFAISGGTILAKGGGTSGGYDASSYRVARQGGSGGGGTWNDLSGASSNQPSFSGWTKFGHVGGNGTSGGGGGAGGGAGSIGANAVSSTGGNGGSGILFSDFTSYGASGYFGGGGGGGSDNGTAGSAQHGGGAGVSSTYASGVNGTATTGGGGGGTGNPGGYSSFNYKGGNGGSGTILIKY